MVASRVGPITNREISPKVVAAAAKGGHSDKRRQRLPVSRAAAEHDAISPHGTVLHRHSPPLMLPAPDLAEDLLGCRHELVRVRGWTNAFTSGTWSRPGSARSSALCWAWVQ